MLSHIDWLREFCLSLPHATEDIQWGNNLLFRIAQKIFCVMCLEPQAPVKFSFKCTPEKFAELVEVEGIIPAPYMARNHWVGIVDINALRPPEFKDLVRNSYQLVLERLPRKTQVEIAGSGNLNAGKKKAARKKARASR